VNIYNYAFRVTCPNDGKTIEYFLTIQHDDIIMCENIVSACLFPDAAFHEAVADQIAIELPGYQSIRATHSGVRVETQRNMPSS